MRLRWVIKTSDEQFSGTDSDVYLALSGTERTMPEVRIDNPDSNDNFEKGDIDTGIIVVERDLGPLMTGQLRVDIDDGDHPWKVDWIQVMPEGVPTGGAGGWRADINAAADENGMFPMLRFRRMGETAEQEDGAPRPRPRQGSDIDEGQVARELAETEGQLRVLRMQEDLARKKQELLMLQEKLFPPFGPAFRTYELYGMMNNQVCPLDDVITKAADGRLMVKEGGRLIVGQEPSDGYGLAGSPGAWFKHVDVGPGVFELEPDGGVLTSDGQRVMVCTAEFLVSAFGDQWRSVVYSQ